MSSYWILSTYFIAGSNESQAVEHIGKKRANSRHYCCVPDHHNYSGGNVVRGKLNLPKVSFHGFPDVKSAKGKKWIKLIRRDIGSNFAVNKNTKICSDHFTSSDYYISLLEVKTAS